MWGLKKIKFGVLSSIIGIAGSSTMVAKSPVPDTLQNKVRHELVMLPRMNRLFGDLSFRVDGSVVTLFGEVTQPFMKDDAGRAVKHIEGVTRVDNEIEVLPLSPMDDRIRVHEARAVLAGPLSRYAQGPLPSIHIIVKNGNVKLTGIVDSKGDSQLAYIKANGVPGVFSVTNELRVEK
jgi:hyperosmotically inducible protein